MTKLEREIFAELRPKLVEIYKIKHGGDAEYLSKVAAGVVKRYIDKAWEAGSVFDSLTKEQWLKENGVTE
jgi:hypothetical protein